LPSEDLFYGRGLSDRDNYTQSPNLLKYSTDFSGEILKAEESSLIVNFMERPTSARLSASHFLSETVNFEQVDLPKESASVRALNPNETTLSPFSYTYPITNELTPSIF
jgi:hypothetical protein